MKKTALFLLFLLIFSCQTVQKPNTYKTEAEAVAAIQQLEERKLSADEAEQKEIDTEISQIIKDMQRMQLIEVPVEVPIQKFESPVSAKNEYSINKTSNLLAQNQRISTQQLVEGNFHYSEIVYNYVSGIIYPVHTTTLRVTTVQLEKGEMLISYLIGDSINWILTNEFINGVVNIYIKPAKPNIITNLVINTTRRRYVLNLTSNCNYMPTVRWNYGLSTMPAYDYPAQPTTAATTPITENRQQLAEKRKLQYERQDDLVMMGLLDDVNFDYEVKYKSTKNYRPKWYPGRIFDDGFRTYIHIPNLDKTPIRPVIFSSDDKGKEYHLVNYRVLGKYYIADTIAERLILTTERENKKETIYINKK